MLSRIRNVSEVAALEDTGPPPEKSSFPMLPAKGHRWRSDLCAASVALQRVDNKLKRKAR
jgi:hypothetical protein